MNWPQVPFESIYAEPSRNGIYKSSEHHGSGAKIVNMGELFANEFIGPQDMARLAMTPQELEKSGLAEGDLLFGRRSLVESGAGKCSLVDGIAEPTTFESSLIRVRLDYRRAVPRFYYYWLRSPQGRGRIRAIVSGTNVKGIRGSDLRNIEVPLPEKSTQSKLVDVLRAYDDLIDNNRRRIRLLEESARLLYREWFVHLHFPGHEHVTQLDGVPEGWTRQSVGNLVSYLNRGITPKYDDDAPGLVINQKCIRNRLLNLDLARRQSKEVPAEKQVRRGDVLINSTGEGTLGRVAQVITNLSDCTVDSHVTIARPGDAVGTFHFGMSLTAFESALAGMGRGATNQTELSRADIAALELLVPSEPIRSEFESNAGDTYEQIACLDAQNKKLAQARDLLLPRLMSGEISV